MENKKENQAEEENSNIEENSISIFKFYKIRDEITHNNSDKLEESPLEENKNQMNDFKVENTDINDKFIRKNNHLDEDNEFISSCLKEVLDKTNKQKETKDKFILNSESELDINQNFNFDSFKKVDQAKDFLFNNKTENNEYSINRNENNFISNTENNQSIIRENFQTENITIKQNSEKKHTALINSENQNNSNKENNNKQHNLNTKKLIHPYSNNLQNNINHHNNSKEEFSDSDIFQYHSESFKIDTHLDKIGYRMFHYKMLLIISLVFFVDSCEMSNVNMLLSSIQNDLNLNTFQKSSLSSAIFIGFFTGSFLSGFTTNKYGRLKPIKYGIVLIFIFSFLTSISKSITQLIMMRILSGLAIGTVVPACKTLVTESIPSSYRSFVLSIVWLLYPIGTVYICFIALNCVEGKEFNWRKVFMINSLGSFVLIILVQFLTESPRYLLKNGKSQEAIELLDMIGNSVKEGSKIKLSENEKNMIYVEARMLQGMEVDEHTTSNANSDATIKHETNYLSEATSSTAQMRIRCKNPSNFSSESINEPAAAPAAFSNQEPNRSAVLAKENKDQIFQEEEKYTKVVNIQCNLDMLKFKKKINTNSVKLLFSKKYLLTSILLTVIWFSTSFVSFGLLYSLPKLFDKVSNNNKQDSMHKMIKTMLFVSPSAILRGYISELKFLGRKHTLALGFFGALVNSIICFSICSNLHFFSGMLKFFIHVSSGTVSIYTSEVYPTEVRSLAIGFGTSITRVGAFLSSFACEIFDGFTPKGSFMLFGITCFVSWICSMSLKYETLGKPLDYDVDNDEDENLKSEENLDLKLNKGNEFSYVKSEKNEVLENTNEMGSINNTKTIFDKDELAGMTLKNMII